MNGRIESLPCKMVGLGGLETTDLALIRGFYGAIMHSSVAMIPADDLTHGHVMA